MIEVVPPGEKPTATIISYSGETIEEFYLDQGTNNIDAVRFSDMNYSIRIKNGKNVLVQKI